MIATRQPDDAVPFRVTQCAICGSTGSATEIYPATLDADAFSARVFSARRLPDRIHYRIVRCNSCGLVRSDPVAADELLERLYAESSFNYDAEVDSLTRTYGRYLGRLERFGAGTRDLLEIGSGNGFFLREAARRGYGRVVGVEPSHDAVRHAGTDVEIVCDIMRPGLFAPRSFDVVCLFQVIDHLPDPNVVLRECLSVLRPGGLVLAFNHDVSAPSARLLGEHSPIIDVEHTYLFDQRTMAALLASAGFEVVEVGSARNLYPLRYLAHLLPLPRVLKTAVSRVLTLSDLGRVRFWAPLGNLYAIGRRPEVPAP